MASGPDRRTFVRGAAGAVGLGAVGALSTKLELGAESRSADKNQAVQRIQVLLVPNGGRQAGMSVFVPPASAHRTDRVIWEATTPNIESIKMIRFKEPGPKYPNPFSHTAAAIPNPGSGSDMELPVLADAPFGHYTYAISVKEVGNGTHHTDPDLDIVG